MDDTSQVWSSNFLFFLLFESLSYCFMFWEISQLYFPHPSTEFIISAETF